MLFLTRRPNKNAPLVLCNILRYQFSEFSSATDAETTTDNRQDEGRNSFVHCVWLCDLSQILPI